ncbi:unnamed protein product, partial [Acanthoscelides obtectus]
RSERLGWAQTDRPLRRKRPRTVVRHPRHGSRLSPLESQSLSAASSTAPGPVASASELLCGLLLCFLVFCIGGTKHGVV